MKIQVTQAHVLAARNSFVHTNPVEVAVQELNTFESVATRRSRAHGYVLEVDNRKIKLAPQAKQAIELFEAGKEVSPFSFILPVSTSAPRQDVMLREMMEIDFDGGMGW